MRGTSLWFFPCAALPKLHWDPSGLRSKPETSSCDCDDSIATFFVGDDYTEKPWWTNRIFDITDALAARAKRRRACASAAKTEHRAMRPT
jgi:hypothetical protein